MKHCHVVVCITGAAGLSDYVASKHAAVGFTESLRFDLRNYNAKGVRCLTVCPYAVSYVQCPTAF
jgi:all-trans-retinol dehydrogenase (NAD+)